MAAIILPHRWRQQPQGPVDVDPQVADAFGITGVWSGANPRHVWGRVRGGIVPVQSSGTSAPGAFAGGRFQVATTGSTTAINLGLQALQLFARNAGNSTSTGTIATVWRATDATARGNSVLFGSQGTNGSDGRIWINAPFSDGNLYFDFGNSGSGRIATGYTKVAGQVESLVLSAQSINRFIYRGGRQIAAVNGSGFADIAGTLQVAPMFILGAPTGAQSDNASAALFVFSNFGWSEAQAFSWSEAPYQLFRPITRRIWVGAAVSGLPVLSAATVTDIGTTSVRPRVTITI